MELKVAFLSYKCSRGAEILRQLKAKNISLEAIFIESPKPLERVRAAIRSMTYGKSYSLYSEDYSAYSYQRKAMTG